MSGSGTKAVGAGARSGQPGSLLRGLRTAAATLLPGVVLGYGLMLAIDATQPANAQVLAEQTARESSAPYEDDVALRYYARTRWLATRNVALAVTVLLAPAVVLAAFGGRVRGRGQARTTQGYWIAAIGATTVLAFVATGLLYLFNLSTLASAAVPTNFARTSQIGYADLSWAA